MDLQHEFTRVLTKQEQGLDLGENDLGRAEDRSMLYSMSKKGTVG